MLHPHMTLQTVRERDLGSLETPRDENAMRNQQPTDAPDAPTKTGTIRRSFSWGKKKRAEKQAEKPAEKQAPAAPTLVNELIDIEVDRSQWDNELGFEKHAVTGEIIVSHVGAAVRGISVGDGVRCIQGVMLDVEGVPLNDDMLDNLDAARSIFNTSTERVLLTIETACLRTELLQRPKALRGTSLDRLGITLNAVDFNQEHVIVSAIEGLAAKSKRIAVGDRLVTINGVRFVDLGEAVELLDNDEVELVFVYGFLPPENHEFESATGTFVPRKSETIGQSIRRSLSFGKKKKGSADGATPRVNSSRESSECDYTPRAIPELNLEPRHVLINKNEHGKILVSYRAHLVTGELIISLVGEDGPAAQAGVELGDVVLSLQGVDMQALRGDEAQMEAMAVLEETQDFDSVEMVLQTQLRTEALAFAAKELGGPKRFLGLSFYTFPDDYAVRITNIDGAAARSGRFALGDRIVSMNGIRVNHAQTLSEHIAAANATSSFVTFEVAHGYSNGEGLWYGKEFASMNGEGPGTSVATDPFAADGAAAPSPTPPPPQNQKPKRSFSFGKRPKF